jgi:hypothetical protein
MVDLITNHDVKWMAPSPLWRHNMETAGESGAETISQPSILRFASDSFMEEFLALMNYYPNQLKQWVARPETWRQPAPAPDVSKLIDVAKPVSQFSQKIKKLTLDADLAKIGTNAQDSNGAEPDEATSEPLPFKLFQPAHQRFYLVAASLVCDRPGLPYRNVDEGRQEKVSFVIRRVTAQNGQTAVPQAAASGPQNGIEYAFIRTVSGGVWQKLAADKQTELADGEEQLPLFNLDFADVIGRKRRLYAGTIPVGNREVYHSAKETDDQAADSTPADLAQVKQKATAMDPRKGLFMSQVIAPWKALVEQERSAKESWQQSVNEAWQEPDKTTKFNQAKIEFEKVIASTRSQIQTGSWYILLDFAKYLDEYISGIWTANTITDTNNPTRKIYDALRSAQIDENVRTDIAATTAYSKEKIHTNLFDALVAIKGEHDKQKAKTIEDNLESVDVAYDQTVFPLNQIDKRWPDFLFPLADPAPLPLALPGTPQPIPAPINVSITAPLPDITVDDEIKKFVDEGDDLEMALAVLDTLANRVAEALPPATSTQPEIPLALQADVSRRDSWFIIRCVYERPNCGPLHPPVVSDPTRTFQLAAFFDPDAPARPIRIPMPLDTSPAGLRKFSKNAGFAISDIFCGQLKRMRKLTFGDLVLSVLPWPFHKDLPDPGSTGPCGKDADNTLGMICSLSIPIVTICAFILLLIIVQLFDYFFRWIPYLFVCLPIPGFKGKKP